MLCGSFCRVVYERSCSAKGRNRTWTKDLYLMYCYSTECTEKIFCVSFIRIQLLQNHENIVYCLTLLRNFPYLDKKHVLIVFQNIPIERFWPEVNNRVNYPIKKILIEMYTNQIIDMEDEVAKYGFSAFSCIVSSYGFRQFSQLQEHSSNCGLVSQ